MDAAAVVGRGAEEALPEFLAPPAKVALRFPKLCAMRSRMLPTESSAFGC